MQVNGTNFGPGLNIKWNGIDDYLDVHNFDEISENYSRASVFGDKIDIDKSIKLVMEGCSPSAESTASFSS